MPKRPVEFYCYELEPLCSEHAPSDAHPRSPDTKSIILVSHILGYWPVAETICGRRLYNILLKLSFNKLNL